MTAKTRVGVLGAGQLALMLAEAGERLGVEVICAGRPGDCAERVAPVLAVELDDAAMVRAFAVNTLRQSQRPFSPRVRVRNKYPARSSSRRKRRALSRPT